MSKSTERKINDTSLAVVCILMGILTELAFTIPFIAVEQKEYQHLIGESTSWSVAMIAQIRYLLKNYDLSVSLMAIGFAGGYFFFIKNYIWEISKLNIIFSCIFTFFMMIGKCFKDAGNMDFIFSSFGHFLLVFLLGVGYFCFFYMVLSILYYQYKKSSLKNIEQNRKSQFFLMIYFDKNPFLFSFFCCFFCWMLYLFFYYPGAVHWDGLRQLDFFIGSLEWTKFHPAFSTMLIGVLFKLGRWIGGNDNAGIFMYSLFQSIVGSMVIAYAILLLKRWGISIKWRIMILLYFSLFSIWQIFSIMLIKDTLYYLAVLFWMLLLLDIVISKTEISFGKIGGVIFRSLLVTLFRNNGIYIVIPTLLIFIIAFKRYRKYFVESLVAVFILYGWINYIFVAIVGVKEGEIREALSIPFQQTARYQKEYPEDVTEKEKEIISKILKYEELAKLYNPDLSDPVKGSQHNKITKEELKGYFQVWWKQLLRHPMCYIESFLNGTYRYFYLDSLEYKGIGFYGIVTDPYVNRGDFQFYFFDSRLDGRRILENLDYIEYKLPIINLLYRPSIYTWLLLGAVFITLKEKKYLKLVIFVPVLFSLLVNMASPVNGSIRYSLPIMAVTPFLLLYVLNDFKRDLEGTI